MTEHLTETQHLEQRITRALVTIRREWPALRLGPPSSRPGGGSKSAQITADDHNRGGWHVLGDSVIDVDAMTRLSALRRTVTEVLNSWSRVIVEDRIMPTIEHMTAQEIREYLTKVAPRGDHAPAMCVFLERHAQWMSGHEAAEDMVDEVEGLATGVTRFTQPQRRQWINLGSCPLEIEVVGETGSEGQRGDLVMEVCGGQVRAWPRAEDRDGEVMARCRRCGIEAVPSWWEARMFDDPELRVLLTAEEVVGFVHRAYGKVIKAATVRQWDKRGTIEPAGHDDKGRRLYAREALVWALDLQERREAMGL